MLIARFGTSLQLIVLGKEEAAGVLSCCRFGRQGAHPLASQYTIKEEKHQLREVMQVLYVDDEKGSVIGLTEQSRPFGVFVCLSRCGGSIRRGNTSYNLGWPTLHRR